MKIGLVTDSLANLGLDELLAFCAEQGIDSVEFAAGKVFGIAGGSAAPRAP